MKLFAKLTKTRPIQVCFVPFGVKIVATFFNPRGNQTMSMLKEFKEFAIKGNVVDLAVGVGVLVPGADDAEDPDRGDGERDDLDGSDRVAEGDPGDEDARERGGGEDELGSGGAEVAGFRGYYLKNEAVNMTFGLWQFVQEHFMKKGYTPMMVPSLVRKQTLYGTGFARLDEATQKTVVKGGIRWTIRDGIVVVKKGAVIPEGTRIM